MRHPILILSALTLGGLFTVPALEAQQPNWQAKPTYSTVNLSAGFTPDPWSQRLQAGGSHDIGRSVGGACVGFINAAAPDVDLNYSNPGQFKVFISVQSSADTTLAVLDPDGRWHCNDDAIGLNPLVVFDNPRPGNYNIWVGVHGQSGLSDAVLHISEIRPTEAFYGQGGASQPNWSATPTFTTVNLRAGFTPDPWTFNLMAGGNDDIARSIGGECVGFIMASAPDVDLNYQAGTFNLYIHVESSADTTLAVLDPDGRWHCNDDAIGLDPVVAFRNPRSGNYNIWVGRHGQAGTTSARLRITEIDPR